ncbi:MAG: hypothetical protein PUB39_05990, partial [Eubacteriales bacterium]|nr:hypothetical protein [Eubacteriales bacterium]
APKPEKISISLSQKAGKAVKITWTSRGMKTRLERRAGSKGKWRKLKDSSADKTSFTDKSMKNGVLYYYRAIPQEKSYQSEYRSAVEKAMLVKKASVRSATWRKGKLIVKYQVPKIYGRAAGKTGGKALLEVKVSGSKKFRKGKYKTYRAASKKTFTKKMKKAKAGYVEVTVLVKAGGRTFRSPAVRKKVKSGR